MKTLKQYQKECYATAKEKGWHDADKNGSFVEKLCLLHAEISEAVEEYRKGFDPDAIYFASSSENPIEKPEGVAIELADVFIRLMDTCEEYGIDLERAVEIKMEYNKTRSYRHGNKKI